MVSINAVKLVIEGVGYFSVIEYRFELAWANIDTIMGGLAPG